MKSINRNMTRKIKKTGVALAVSLAMMFTAMPFATVTTYAATESSTYVAEATTTFTFTDTDISSSVESEDYTIDGTDLTIKSSGSYILTGSCSEGSVTVKKGVTNVTLVLQDFNLTSSSGAPITINKNNTNTTIVIAGTNTLTDNENPDDEESTDAEVAEAFEGAGIKLKSSGTLLITGDGTLNVNGNCKNGIKGADNSTITIGADSDDTFTLNVTATNDGISGDGADGVAGLNIIGGNINVGATDDAIKSDYILNIGQSATEEGATINVTNCTEGLEGATVNLYGGTATIKSTDDGINAANSDLDGMYAFSLNIYGGTWNIDAGGDGIDSNGTITVSGGITDISSSTQNENNAIDWGDNSSITVTGGTIIGVGMGGMQQGFTNGNYVMFSANLSKGNVISITDNSGNVLYSTTVKKSANSVIFSSEDLVDGATYTLKVNGSTVATATEGVSQNGMQPGGMQPGGFQPNGAMPGAFSTGFEDRTLPGGYNENETDIATNTSTIAVYRLYNPNSGEHFYTSNKSESYLLQNVGWTYEGVAFQGYNSQSGVAVYRVYNPNAGDHHYTTNYAEVVNLVSVGWNYEGIAFYTPDNGTTPVYRLYNPNAISGAHHYTMNYNEYTYLISVGGNGENVAWYSD